MRAEGMKREERVHAVAPYLMDTHTGTHRYTQVNRIPVCRQNLAQRSSPIAVLQDNDASASRQKHSECNDDHDHA
jgi:hypothetical protein